MIGTITVVTRFDALGEHSLWLDEVKSLEDSDTLGSAVSKRFHPPLFFALLHLWRRLVGDEVDSLRALSAIGGVLTVVATYHLARRVLQHRGAAIVAAGLLSVMPLALFFSRELRMYSWWPLFVTLAGIALVDGGMRGRRATVVGYWVASLAAVLTHFYSAFYLGAFALVVVALPLDGRTLAQRVRAVVVLHVPFLAAAAIAGGRAAMRLDGTWRSPLAFLSKHAAGEAGGLGDLAHRAAHLIYFRNWAFRSETNSTLAIGLVVLVVLGVCSFVLVRRGSSAERAPVLLLLTSVWLPLVLLVLLPVRDYARLLSPTLPFMSIVCSGALLQLATLHGRSTVLAAAALLGGFLATLISSQDHVFRDEVEPWNTICSAVESTEREGDLVLISAMYMRKPLLACFRGRSEVVGFPDDKVSIDALPAIAADAGAIWLVYSHNWNEEYADTNDAALTTLTPTFTETMRLEPGPLIRAHRLVRRQRDAR